MYYTPICILHCQYKYTYTYLDRPFWTMESVFQDSKDTDKHMDTHSILNSQKLILVWADKNNLSLFWTSFKPDFSHVFLSTFYMSYFS